MASSRNKNTSGNYKSEIEKLERFRTHTLYSGSVSNDTICYPGDGLLGCKNPNLVLLNNYADIESDLFGIGSTNLVNPKSVETHTFHSYKVLDIQKRNTVILPEPLTVSKYNRPNFH